MYVYECFVLNKINNKYLMIQLSIVINNDSHSMDHDIDVVAATLAL